MDELIIDYTSEVLQSEYISHYKIDGGFRITHIPNMDGGKDDDVTRDDLMGFIYEKFKSITGDL